MVCHFEGIKASFHIQKRQTSLFYLQFQERQPFWVLAFSPFSDRWRIIFLGLLEQSTTSGLLKIAENYYLTFVESVNLKPRCLKGYAPSGTYKEIFQCLFLGFGSLPVISFAPWLPFSLPSHGRLLRRRPFIWDQGFTLLLDGLILT